MRGIRTLGMAIALFGITYLAHAYPTLTGPTGMAIFPTAETAPVGVAVAADWQEFTDGHAIPIRAILALGDTFELGAMYTPFSDTVPALDKMWGANAKIRLGKLVGGDSALGAQFLRLEDDTGFQIDFPQAYFAWTTDFGGGDSPMFGLTWGANWTRVDPEVGDSNDAFRFFGGVSVNVGRSISLLGEIQSADSDIDDIKPITSATARIGLGSTLNAQVGYTNALGVIGVEDHNWFAGLNLAFGGGDGY